MKNLSDSMREAYLQEAIEDCADECGWISENEFCVWVDYVNFDVFMDRLKKLFGNGIFDDGGFVGHMKHDCVCIDLCEALEGYDFPFEEVFPKSEYEH